MSNPQISLPSSLPFSSYRLPNRRNRQLSSKTRSHLSATQHRRYFRRTIRWRGSRISNFGGIHETNDEEEDRVGGLRRSRKGSVSWDCAKLRVKGELRRKENDLEESSSRSLLCRIVFSLFLYFSVGCTVLFNLLSIHVIRRARAEVVSLCGFFAGTRRS